MSTTPPNKTTKPCAKYVSYKKYLTFSYINSYIICMIVNLKLPEQLHKEFLSAVKVRGGTMQSVLAAFVMSYVEDPDHFQIKLEVVDDRPIKRR